MDKKSLFLQVYANLPIDSRKEIVAFIDGEPLTWQVAKLEIENDTPTGDKILDFLIIAKILKQEE